MSMPRAVRHINESRTLATLFRHGPMSRADLARRLKLTRSTAGNIAANLIEGGALIEVDGGPGARGESRSGRPGQEIALNPGHAYFAGLDIATDTVTVAIIDFRADAIATRARPLSAVSRSPEAVLAEAADFFELVLSETPNSGAIKGMCLTLPGLVDRAGRLFRVPFLDWGPTDFGAMLVERLKWTRAFLAENDANAFAVAEEHRRVATAEGSALYIFMDAGIGGGLYSGGKLFRGHNGYAGEIGHMAIGDAGFAPVAELPGSFESYVGREALIECYRREGGLPTGLAGLIEALAAGEPPALAAARTWAHWLGRGLGSLISVLDPGRIMLGGPVSAAFPFVRAEAMASLARTLPKGHPLPPIGVTGFGESASAIGGALLLHSERLAIDEQLVFDR